MIGSSESKAIISLQKSTFDAGETIIVDCNLDNSRCKKAVKSIEVKVKRMTQCMEAGRIVWKKEEDIAP